MTVKFFFAGITSGVSKAGRRWGTAFIHPMREDGSHELLQMQAKCFDEDLVESLSRVKPGTELTLDLDIKEPIIRGIKRGADDEVIQL